MTKRKLLSGAIHELVIGGEVIIFCDGQLAGSRQVVRALKIRMVGIADPTIRDLDVAARSLCARRQETFVSCECDLCSADAIVGDHLV